MMEGAFERRSPGYPNRLIVGRRILTLTKAALMKLFARPRSSRRLVLEERIAIGSRKELILVNCSGRRILLAATADAVISLGEILPCPDGNYREGSATSTRQQEHL